MNLLSAFLLGSALGSINGFICRILLKKNLDKSDKKFFSLFFMCLFYKLLFLVLSVLILRYEKSIILIIYCLSLIVSQLVFELKPLKK